jgi:uncharacterized protein
MRISTLFVIMKVVERCNLNCSYCYYYMPENADVYSRPVLMAAPTRQALLDYLVQATEDCDIGAIVFAFHGGEPTLAKPDTVRDFCASARAALAGRTGQVKFAIQTNGVHLTEAWLRVIAEEGIHVGVSMDGDKQTHDTWRVDHRGRGSYDRIRANLERLEPVTREAGVNLATLTVMGPDFQGLAYYRHMVGELGLRDLKLLYTDCTNDNPPPVEQAERLGQALCDIFDHWLVHDAARVRIVPFQDAITAVVAAETGKVPVTNGITLGCSVLSDGRVQMSDDFMAPATWFAGQHARTVFDSTFADWYASGPVREATDALAQVPTACRACPHAASCRGGEVPHRYSRERGFDNPSAHCVTLKKFYGHVTERLRAGIRQVRPDRAPAESVPA